MTVTILRFDVDTAFKVGFVLNILVFAVFGLIGIVIPFLILRLASPGYDDPRLNLAINVSVVLICLSYVGGIIGAGVLGGIGFAIYALLYNLTVRKG